MEHITITRRVINGKKICNKRFDEYEHGYYGRRISNTEFEESKQFAQENNLIKWNDTDRFEERYIYEN